MNVFEKVYRTLRQQDLIDDLNNRYLDLSIDYSDSVAKVSNLNSIIYQFENKDKVELASKIAMLENQVNEDDGTIESLKTELSINGALTTARPTFIESVSLGGNFYYPKKTINNTIYSLKDPRDMYVPSAKTIVWARERRKYPKLDKKMLAWEKGILGSKYVYDNGENWQTQSETEARGEGDCEDEANDVVTTAKALGVPSNEVFLAVGPTTFGYHAYPIMYLSYEELKELYKYDNSLWPNKPVQIPMAQWFIFEATLDILPEKPKPLIGSSYWIDAGVQNWEHYGTIKRENLSLFNGVAASSRVCGAIELDKIENSKEKRKKILDYWGQNHSL